MSNIQQHRSRSARPAHDSSIWPTAIAAAVCFALSATAVLNWDTIKSPSRWWPMLSGADPNVPRASKNRLGQAETAPLLQSCVTKALLPFDPGPKYEPWMMWVDLNAGIRAGILTADINTPREHGRVELTQRWGKAAGCVYQQNTSALCDIDNRVLAVQTAINFVRLADEIIATPRSFAASAEDIADLQGIKDRVLDALKRQLERGALISSDFGAFVPKTVRDVLSTAKTTSDVCAPAH